MIFYEYYNCINIWDLAATNELPLYYNINHQIELIDGSTPVIKKAYDLSRKQAAILKEILIRC